MQAVTTIGLDIAKLTVEHVHVHSGGQAVVGVVETPGGGDRRQKFRMAPMGQDWQLAFGIGFIVGFRALRLNDRARSFHNVTRQVPMIWQVLEFDAWRDLANQQSARSFAPAIF